MENQHKNNLLDWEVELCQTIEQHEFDFDPNAWDSMDELLKVNSLLNTPEKKSITISTTKLITIVTLGFMLNWVMISVILSQYERKNNTTPVQNTNISIDAKENNLKTNVHLKETIILHEKTLKILTSTITQIENTTKDDETVLETEKTNELRRVKVELLPFLNTIKIPFLKTPTFSLDTSVIKIMPPKIASKKKRNRKTLFPDIIE